MLFTFSCEFLFPLFQSSSPFLGNTIQGIINIRQPITYIFSFPILQYVSNYSFSPFWKFQAKIGSVSVNIPFQYANCRKLCTLLFYIPLFFSPRSPLILIPPHYILNTIAKISKYIFRSNFDFSIQASIPLRDNHILIVSSPIFDCFKIFPNLSFIFFLHTINQFRNPNFRNSDHKFNLSWIRKLQLIVDWEFSSNLTSVAERIQSF